MLVRLPRPYTAFYTSRITYYVPHPARIISFQFRHDLAA